MSWQVSLRQLQKHETREKVMKHVERQGPADFRAFPRVKPLGVLLLALLVFLLARCGPDAEPDAGPDAARSQGAAAPAERSRVPVSSPSPSNQETARQQEHQAFLDTLEAMDTWDTWEILGQVSFVDRGNYTFEPVYTDEVRQLDGQEIELQGYMIPGDQRTGQTFFLLSLYPVAECYFCLPGGPETFIEVRSETPIPYQFDPLTLQGNLEVLGPEEVREIGVFYRMRDPEATYN